MSGIIGGAGSKSGVIGETEIDYEEGTWTPGFSGATVSPGNTIGYYTKIGDVVFWSWFSSSSAISGTSGNDAIINALPFTNKNVTGNYSPFNSQWGNAINGSSRGGYIPNNSTQMHFIDDGAASDAGFIDGGSSMYINVSGHYKV